MKRIPILIDFDGVINLGNQPANDAKDFLHFLSSSNFQSFIISNSSLKTSKEIVNFLREHNIDFNIQAMTAADAALKYVKDHYKKVSIYCSESIKNIFIESGSCRIDDDNPEAVVIGDIGDKWDFKLMNEIFQKIYYGADLIAMHKNKYWKPDGKTLTLDAGAFITAIEFASSKEAILIGKPSPLYFKLALSELKINEGEEFIMIGDDIESDINAVQKIGGKGILVYTGKTKFPLPKNFVPKPDYEAKNLTEVIELLKKIFK